MPYYIRDPKRDHNFDNYPYKGRDPWSALKGPKESRAAGIPCRLSGPISSEEPSLATPGAQFCLMVSFDGGGTLCKTLYTLLA